MKKIVFLILILLAACTARPAQTILPLQTDKTSVPSAVPIPSAVQTKLEPPFPRLGMIWPNPYEQPLAQIARYDWVILDNWQVDFIDPLQALNPNMLLLTSTNASEVAFRPDDPVFNEYLQTIPYQWYLTQVGTTLSADVDSTQTTFPVNELVAHGTNNDIQLFVPGDTALIEGESVYIENVNPSNRTVTVRRGYIRPPSAHKAGTRLAAHISFWPNTWVLNLSTLSPLGIADSSHGPERWADYQSRLDAQSLADKRWAGIFVDRSGQDASWLIGNSTARSIDPDQSNRLLTDYAAFDSAWNTGLRSYLDQLRAAIGPNRIIYLNRGIPHYSVVNGSNFEGVPDESWFDSWHAQIFGPLKTGSYADWVSHASQPNLTMLETYQDNSRVAPTDTKSYINPCVDKSFVPNYQKMRFGLTSALLKDGYFSYEMNTQGHGSLCLMWFDEYDNAGFGRGYLGYPHGPSFRLDESVLPNLLPTNGTVTDQQLSAWKTWSDKGYDLQARPDSVSAGEGAGSIRIDVKKAQGEDWRAAFSYAPLSLAKDSDYTIAFWARSDRPRTIHIWLQKDSEPWDVWLDFGILSLSNDWQKFEITLPSSGDDPTARLTFGMGAGVGSVWLDDLRFYKGNADIWQRNFDNGIVLVNATTESLTIPLNAIYRKINGTQDRSVNDGSLVREVILRPKDGIILLQNK